MIQTNLISFKQTYVNENNSYNKPFTIRIEQIFRCSLWNNIAYQNQTFSSEKLQSLLLSRKAQKTQDDSWSYCRQVQEMPLRTLPETVAYQGQIDKGEVLSRHRYKETRILLINPVAFSEVEVKTKIRWSYSYVSFLWFAFYFDVDYKFILT